MLASFYDKLIGVVLMAFFCLGLFLWGHHEGASAIQAKWDAATVTQKIAVAQAKVTQDAENTAMMNNYNALSANYEVAIHAKAPILADITSHAMSGGTLRLRDVSMCPSSGNVSAATVRSRAADAAATQALADRVTSAIAAIRAGDDADARESQLDAQIIGLQGILKAERPPP